MSNEVKKKLEASRKELLDLGLRNPLISHSQGAKQVKVIDELSTEIYRMLVLEGKELSFDALPEKDVNSQINTDSGEEILFDAVNQNDLLAQPDDDIVNSQIAARHLDRKLQTNLSSQKLQTRLLSIHNDARSYIEEQGVNILFLVLGFLQWYEADASQEPRRAPLLLIPVELKRASAQERFIPVKKSVTTSHLLKSYALSSILFYQEFLKPKSWISKPITTLSVRPSRAKNAGMWFPMI